MFFFNDQKPKRGGLPLLPNSSVSTTMKWSRVADVMLWRQKNLTVGILLVTLAAWVVFELSGYTLLSLVSSVFLLLVSILFLWAKSAAILNRPAPPLPNLYLSEEIVNEVAAFIRTRTNTLLQVSQDIALGKDSRMFFKVAAYLWLISVVGGLTDFLTLGYISLVIVLTVPALYERYEDYIDRYVMMGYRKLQLLYMKLDEECISKVQKWILEKRKLS
ncbi:reticulon-like protein B12 isoform X1 [Vitis vinifera]|uniref:reticulon-like protein B12 isoform X1 n=2 Tax=Vitis vinifera TaxID=29760 RepID=UPI0028834E75|nr:reticulon-like protein B12 isoform X1 [Vitis vinifera]